MLIQTITHSILSQLPFVPNACQQQLVQLWASFLTSRTERRCFILRGYAGTGKTSMVAALVRAMSGMQVPCVLLAPTGRAAKVMSRYAGMPAYTIHKAIYRQDATGHFSLAPNMLQRGIFVVDEASMISSMRDNPLFGTGSLLDDLVSYIYSRARCYMIIVGDDAQLPPVGQTESHALDAGYMSGYGLNVTEHVLTEVARQALDSGVLRVATAIRAGEDYASLIPDYREGTSELPDIVRITPQQVSEFIERSYAEVGVDQTLILTSSNWRTNIYNGGVRARILWREDALSAGDRIMVIRNNYLPTPPDEEPTDEVRFLANGEMLEIRRLRHEREMYGFHFVDAELIGVDSEFEITRVLWLDTLSAERPEDIYTMQKTLYERIAEDYPEIRSQRLLREAVLSSPYYCALQVRFAYAVTTHKAQGGQWSHIYVDVPQTSEWSDEEMRRWLYTAVTRSTERVFWVEQKQ